MSLRASVLALLSLISISSTRAETPATVWPDEVTIPNTRIIRFTSTINGEPYAIAVGTPLGPPPDGGYSVIYVLDGEAYFSTGQLFSVAMLDKAPVVVGIGHGALNDKTVIARYAGRTPEDTSPIGLHDVNSAFQRLRVLDMTLPLAPEHRSPAWFGNDVGGNVDAFLKVIETEIKPRVAAIVKVNSANQALFRHSFGGLAVVRALFTELNAFRTFIASSPSLWWDGGSVLAGEDFFASQIRAGIAAPRVLITSAANEPDSSIPPKSVLDTLPPDKVAEIAPYLKMEAKWPGMKSGARTLADEIGKLKGKTGYKVKYQIVPDTDHPDAPFTTIGRGIHYAFDSPP